MTHVLDIVWNTALRSSVSWAVGFVMGTLVVKNLKRVLHRIEDQLNTETPGGLHDVVEAQRDTNAYLRFSRR